MHIVLYPDPILRQTAEPVVSIDGELRRVAREMFDTMYGASGVGLAATQVGLLLRLFVLNLAGEPGDELVLINPEMLRETGEQIVEEGCLSLPGITGSIRRPVEVVVRGYDLKGKEVEYECRDLWARAVCHEMDHLEGRLIIDRMGPAARLSNRARLKELEGEYRSTDSSTREREAAGIDTGRQAGTDASAPTTNSDS